MTVLQSFFVNLQKLINGLCFMVLMCRKALLTDRNITFRIQANEFNFLKFVIYAIHYKILIHIIN